MVFSVQVDILSIFNSRKVKLNNYQSELFSCRQEESREGSNDLRVLSSSQVR